MSGELLLISANPDDPAFLSQVGDVLDADVVTQPDPIKAVDLLAEKPFSGIFIDVARLDALKAFEMEVQKRFGLLGDQVQAARVHFIGDGPIHQRRDAIHSPFFAAFYERPLVDVEEAGRYYGRIMKAQEMQNGKTIENFLGEDGGVQPLSIERSGQKQEAVEAIRTYLAEGQVPLRISNTIANIADELLMNALYDAPGDEFGRPIYAVTSRDADRPLQGREQVDIKLGFDGSHFAFAVTDQFGNLDRARLLNHVSIIYKDTEYKLRKGGAGAGLGLATVLQTGGSLIYHCEEGRKTEAIFVTRVYENYRDFKSQFSFFAARFYT
jgi:hypothetical protein